MAAAGDHLRVKDHFLCSICLDVFTDPVTAPCGHNFCRECITGHWKTKLDCPVCTQRFSTKPQLKINVFISGMVHQFKHQDSNEPQEVLCDVCTKEKAVNSCLECQTTYCETHLVPHRGLRGHHLIQPVEKKVKLRWVQQFAVDLTLDPDTAHPELILSEDGKQVHHGDQWKNLPENPQRFSFYPIVLGKESFSSGRFYFEVQVKGKTEWILGVVRESINRKEGIIFSPQHGFWTIRLRNRHQYVAAADDPPVRLSVASPPEKVGVFVDYDEGLVSFYDADAADLLFFFTRYTFTDKLRPYFSPGRHDDGINSAPLIVCPVNQTS